jgi:hypothetical protein
MSLTVASLAAQARPATAALPTQVNSCWSDDHGDPVVDSLSVSATSVDAGGAPATVGITVAAHDTGGPGEPTGVAGVTADVRTTGAGDVGPEAFVDLSRGDDGLWHGSVVFPRGTSATYEIRADAWDGDGARSPFDSPTATVTVTGTPDRATPVLQRFHASTTHVDTRRHAARVVVTAKVTDSVSGVRFVELRVSDQVDTRIPMHRVGDTDRWRTGFTVPRWNGRHPKDLRLAFADRVGNFVVLRSDDLRHAGFPSRVTIRSGPRDATTPHVVRVQAAHRIDVRRHGRWYDVTLVAADNRGVTRVRVGLWPADPALSHRLPFLGAKASLHRVGGTPTLGTWKGRMRVGRCYTGPAHYTIATFVSDRLGTREHHDGLRVKLVSQDNLMPAFRTSDVEAARHVVTWSFSERVHGISSDGVEVTNEAGLVIPGSWECHNGAGDATPCLTGSVRTATFTPDDVSSNDTIPFAVTFAPEHHLDVLDRNGNPVLGTRTVQAEG